MIFQEAIYEYYVATRISLGNENRPISTSFRSVGAGNRISSRSVRRFGRPRYEMVHTIAYILVLKIDDFLRVFQVTDASSRILIEWQIDELTNWATKWAKNWDYESSLLKPIFFLFFFTVENLKFGQTVSNNLANVKNFFYRSHLQNAGRVGK